jgi:AmmeMemoRadiSam system protein A/AmmeMemoRadiSam system protein B
MAELTRRIIANGAETVVLISPHAPLSAHAFVTYRTPQLHGDFANFRAPSAQVEAPLDEELLERIAKVAGEQDYDVLDLKDHELDHGTAVPLYFLHQNGWSGKVVAMGYSFLSNEDHLRFGSCISQAADEVGRPVAFVASGDLSHRLRPEAPAGYSPSAYIFDAEVVDAVRSNAPQRIVNIDQDLRRVAGECGYRSMLVAIGATQQVPLACEVLNYEAPFGVGYLVAQLTSKRKVEPLGQHQAEENSASSNQTEDELPSFARTIVETYVLTGTQLEPPAKPSSLLAARASCFVSIKTLDGQLRGCIGTIQPVKDTLGEELIDNAIHAATRDPRFPPISTGELENLRYSVDILSAAEPTTFEQLDPSIFGVIVEDESGLHRGLLLPDIEGVDTATKQVEIAARKAGIPPGTPLKYSRFRVNRYTEKLR